MIINKSDKLLIAKAAINQLNSKKCLGLCSALIRGSQTYNLFPESYPEKIYKEFLEENFSEIKQIAKEVTVCNHLILLVAEPDFFIDRFWWDSIITISRIEVLNEYIKLLENGK